MNAMPPIDDPRDGPPHDDRRRLRFANDIDPEESIPGFLSRCAADHPVPRLRTLYDEIGFSERLPGSLQFAQLAILDRMAFLTRSDGQALARCAGAEVRAKMVAFGDLRMLAESIECRLRRIAPKTLSEHGVHRLDWLNKNLPFCPISGEMLVSRCSRCGHALGWIHTSGISNCEHCEEPVPPSCDAGLSDEHLASYRLFSRLVSFDEGVRKKAWERLPSELRENSPGSVVNLAIRLHRHLRDRNGEKLKASLHTLAPAEVGEIIAGAIALLEGWPRSVPEAVRAKVDELMDDHAAFVSLWRRLKAISKPNRETGLEQAELLLSALPDLARPVWRGFAPPYRVYLQQEARMKTGLNGSQLRSASAHLTTTMLPSAGKRNIFYKADEIDDLRRLCEETMPLTRVASEWFLPNYAVEQLAFADIVEHAKQPILSAIHSQSRIRRTSVQNFARGIMIGRCRTRQPGESAPLSKAMRIHGGGEKPWAKVFGAMLAGKIPWWVDGNVPNARTVCVRPNDILRLRHRGIEAPRPPPLNRQTISKKDGGEILNVTPSTFQRVATEEGFRFDRISKADATLKETIVDVAERWITAAEIEERMKAVGRTEDLTEVLDGVRKSAAGWWREDAVRRLKIR